MRLFQVLEGLPCDGVVLLLAADFPTICVAMLGGTSFHGNILVCKGNCGQQFVKVNKAIKQYILIPSLAALCIHAFGNFISRQFRYGPIIELNVISPCIEDGPVMCPANCVAIRIALVTDHLSLPQDTAQGEQYLSKDIVVSRLWLWERVKVVISGRTFLIFSSMVWPR
jgi:hypothetical protein